MLLSSALLCIAANVFFESRGEPLLGQIAVANVTMTRAKQNSSKVCRVVLKRKQFSWTISRVAPDGSVRSKAIERDPKSWARSLVIGQLALWQMLPNAAHGATHFHTTKVSPWWASDYKQVARIGNHIFLL